jgi:hypothetical protein
VLVGADPQLGAINPTPKHVVDEEPKKQDEPKKPESKGKDQQRKETVVSVVSILRLSL